MLEKLGKELHKIECEDRTWGNLGSGGWNFSFATQWSDLYLELLSSFFMGLT